MNDLSQDRAAPAANAEQVEVSSASVAIQSLDTQEALLPYALAFFADRPADVYLGRLLRTGIVRGWPRAW